MYMTKEDQAAFERVYSGTSIAESWGFSTVEDLSGMSEYVHAGMREYFKSWYQNRKKRVAETQDKLGDLTMLKKDQELFEKDCLPMLAIVFPNRVNNARTTEDTNVYTESLMRTCYAIYQLGIKQGKLEQAAGLPPAPDSTGVAVVDVNYHWRPMDSCPLGAKVQVLGIGGTATHTIWDGKAVWLGWTPLPTTRRD